MLKHLAKYRPDWTIDVRCGRGKHTALTGLCRKVYHDAEPEPKGPYDTKAEVGFFENYNNYSDRPCSKVTNCLSEVFGINWDESLGRYQINLSAAARLKAEAYLQSIGCQRVEGSHRFNTVIFHTQGNSSGWKKNLKDWQAKRMVDFVLQAGRIPVVLDWDKRSTLPDGKRVFCPAPSKSGDIWGGFGSGDAEMIACLAHFAEAFIGIDSGPGKCASAVDTPTLICWLWHSPMQFHDPAPFTTHLVPHTWRSIPPCDAYSVAQWFEEHYTHRLYHGDDGLVEAGKEWLGEILHYTPPEVTGPVPFVMPQGIGDSVWALTKIKAIAGDGPIDIILSGDANSELCNRAVPFLRRFDFVDSVSVMDVPIQDHPVSWVDEKGRYRYVADGRRKGFHFLMPNGWLEHGKRLEEWLPEFGTDWNIMDHFSWENTERGSELGDKLGRFAAFYLGPEEGNSTNGHNRGWYWEPKHWVELGKALVERGLKIVVVGASYDRSFWEKYVRDGVKQAGMEWVDAVGKFEIGETFALLKKAKCLISYQCGLGIVSHYLGVPVAMWWRPDGDSTHPQYHVAFDNRFKDCWTNPAPEFQARYAGLLYKRETVADIVKIIDERGWAD